MKHSILIPCLLLIMTQVMDTMGQDPPCSGPEYRSFDFWLGEWIVYDSTGQEVGHNVIAKEQNGCLLVENWTSARGHTGTSFSYFLRSDSTWNQVWVDDTGGVLELKGRLRGSSMVLQSGPQKDPGGAAYYNRITWEPADGEVIQTWELLDPDFRV